VALAPSYDTPGWFTSTAADMRAAIGALIGLGQDQRMPRGCYLEMPGLDPDVATACAEAARRLAPPAPAEVRRALEEGFARSIDTYNTVVAREAWAVHQGWAERYRDKYSPAVWQRLNRVHAVTPEQIEAADRHTATLHRLWAEFFRSHEFLVLPASPMPALTKAECTLENRTRILTLTAPASIGGLPILTVPVPLPSGLTTGLQIIVPTATSHVVNWALQRFE
jgi:amidase/aspartyl-tRNA(Asn)/glutamyl-tRNA(Gln) amidotransferase subunit A